jgi:hypothetical protein
MLLQVRLWSPQSQNICDWGGLTPWKLYTERAESSYGLLIQNDRIAAGTIGQG